MNSVLPGESRSTHHNVLFGLDRKPQEGRPVPSRYSIASFLAVSSASGNGSLTR